MFSACPILAGSPVAPAATALARALVTASSVPPLMAHVPLHRVDQVRDQIMPALELDIDLGPRLLGSVPGRDQAVVGEDQPKDDQDDDRDEDPPTHAGLILIPGRGA